MGTPAFAAERRLDERPHQSLEIRDESMPRGDATTTEIAETWADALREAGRVVEADS